MAFTIAVSGKGGVGKSTIAALIMRHLRKTQRQPVLAVDADPNSTLDEHLGLKVHETIGGIREDVQKNVDRLPPSMSKDEYISLRVQECIVESKGLDLLTMGRQEGPGCYCYINHLLRSYLDGMHRHYGFVVIDNEAGMEHLSRRTTQDVDLLLVVSELSAASLRAAGRIRELAESLELKVGKALLVPNRANGPLSPPAEEAIARVGLPVAKVIPADETIEQFSLAGRPLLEAPDDAPAAVAVGEMCNEYIIL
ncbi:MAG: AAA family ATPase [Armatimonadetes bacterium]|nr:AAA family ATPase [Armatimonadota bacterium]